MRGSVADVEPGLRAAGAGPKHWSPAYDAAKRFLDILGAILGLMATGPVLLLCAALIKFQDRGPIIHKRVVLGRGGRHFAAYKLRTMIVDADRYIDERPELREDFERNFKLKSDPRITPAGRWLRKLSLDELPQLINVLRGQMSLIGPRMISPTELAKYGNCGDQLLTVKPGLSGLWQVSGRQETDYAGRIRLDMEYVRQRSLWLDLRIILQTVPALLRRRGAY